MNSRQPFKRLKKDSESRSVVAHSRLDWSSRENSPEELPTTLEELSLSLGHPAHMVREVVLKEEMVSLPIKIVIQLSDGSTKSPLDNSLFAINEILDLNALKLAIASNFGAQIKSHIRPPFIGLIENIQIIVSDTQHNRVPILKRSTITDDATYRCIILSLVCNHGKLGTFCCCGLCESSAHIPELVVDIKSSLFKTALNNDAQNAPTADLEFEPNAFTRSYARFHKNQRDHGNPANPLPKVMIPINALQKLLGNQAQRQALAQDAERSSEAGRQQDKSTRERRKEIRRKEKELRALHKEIDRLQNVRQDLKNDAVKKRSRDAIGSTADGDNEDLDNDIWDGRRKRNGDTGGHMTKSRKTRHKK